jgi:uncharacterized NAD-dependent epimerase/dehydratase family protein
MKKTDAIVYCEGAFNTTNGKTAHGLVRFTERYRVLAVIDSNYAGRDAGVVLDGKSNDIPVVSTITEAITMVTPNLKTPLSLVVGLAPDGGRLDAGAKKDIRLAIASGLNIVSGLHDYLTVDLDFVALAGIKGVTLTDIRKSPPADKLHFFTAAILDVTCLKLAVLGTDSAIGKRTTAWGIVHGLRDAGFKAVLIGTGQTAWLQGATYGVMLDTLVNDFLTGEIEHAVVTAWHKQHPDVIVIEGQGGILNPAYPGGYEIIAAARPDFIILQHAPRRTTYDGFPQFSIEPLEQHIKAAECISGKKVLAVTINHEGMTPEEIPYECLSVTTATGIPAFDVLSDGAQRLVEVIIPHIKK